MKKFDKKGLSLEQAKTNLPSIKKDNHNNILTPKRPTLMESHLLVTFLGVRGTIPTPSKDHIKYGGNTSCVEVTNVANNIATSLLFDAGTGIINYGDNAIKSGVRIFHIFLSHMHYDHIIGLSKFAPLFRKDCEINIYGQAKSSYSLKKIIQNFFSAPFFPIEFKKLPSLKNIHFHEINSFSSIHVGNIQVDMQHLNHPQSALAFKIWNSDKSLSVVYATDHEHGTCKDNELKKFIRNTNLFIYDSTYSECEYKNYKGWGHSTVEYGAKIAKACKVKMFAIFHHDPMHNDEYLEKMVLPAAKKIFINSILAKENLTVGIK